MNPLTLNTRLISAAIAVVTTLGVFHSVTSIAEPQRSVLMAKNQRGQQQPAASVDVALASKSAESVNNDGK